MNKVLLHFFFFTASIPHIYRLHTMLSPPASVFKGVGILPSTLSSQKHIVVPNGAGSSSRFIWLFLLFQEMFKVNFQDVCLWSRKIRKCDFP